MKSQDYLQSTYFFPIVQVKKSLFMSKKTTYKTMIQDIQDGIAQNYV